MTELVHVGNSLQASLAYARELANSGLLPGNYRKQPANVLFALEMGRTLGITTMAAITGINVIEGKPAPSPALMTALIRKAGHKVRVKFDAETSSATATIIRHDDPEFVFESVWTLDRAVQAGLCAIKDGKPFARDSKGRALPWEKYWQAMLKWRSLSEVSRDAAEDCLFGMHYTPEELGVEVNEDGTIVDGELVGEPVSAPPAPTADPAAQKFADAAMFAETKGDIVTLWREAGKDVLGRHVANTAIADPAERAAAPLEFLGDVLRARGEILPEAVTLDVDETATADAPSATESDADALPDTDKARALTEAAAASWTAADTDGVYADSDGQENLL
jgi:hypothetical protein